MALLNYLEFQKRFVDTKSMEIIGSSDSVLKYENGTYIEAHDVVVRFNRTKTDDLEDKVGSRTDILVVNDVNNLKKAPVVRELSNPKVVVCFIDRSGFNKSPTHLSDFLEWVGDADLFLCPRPDIAMVGVDRNTRSFSMGLYALGFLPYALNVEKLFISGFTFFGAVEGGSLHYSKKASFAGTLWHDADMEKMVATQILNEFKMDVTLTEEVFQLVKQIRPNIHCLGKNNQFVSKSRVSFVVLGAIGFILYKIAKIFMKIGYLLRRVAEILRRNRA